MLEIRSIEAFYQLSEHHRTAILKELKTKLRLEDWLRALNDKKKRSSADEDGYVRFPCNHCSGRGEIIIPPRDNRDIHASQITKCLKKVWLDCSGFSEHLKEWVEPRLRMIFAMGTGWHNEIQAWGARGAWGPKANYQAEVDIDPDAKRPDGDAVYPMAEVYWIRGHVDAVIDPYIINVPGIGEVGIKVVHEYKTINSNGYSKLTRPKPEHKWQASIYSICVDAPVIVYIYTNKDNCQMADFPIAFDHGIWQEVERKILRIQGLVEEETPPPWEETANTINPFECGDCGYLDICKPPQKPRKRRYAK